MKARPILFSAPMIRALLNGSKTQTRRTVKDLDIVRVIDSAEFLRRSPYPLALSEGGGTAYVELADGRFVGVRCPYGRPGDFLWVREKWSGGHDQRNTKPSLRAPDTVWYWADGSPSYGDWERPRSSLFMPRWASRLALRITDVRVERLKEIGQEDARAEGIERAGFGGWRDYRGGYVGQGSCGWPSESFRTLWESINGPDSWHANSWVWALSFEVIRANVDDAINRAA